MSKIKVDRVTYRFCVAHHLGRPNPFPGETMTVDGETYEACIAHYEKTGDEG